MRHYKSLIGFGLIAALSASVAAEQSPRVRFVAKTESDDNGGYVFEVDQPGIYVVEMILSYGYVIALSNAGSLARFETLQTVVQVPGRWDSAAQNVIAMTSATEYLGMTSAKTITSTTVTIAADQAIPPVNAGEPVSPR